MSRETDLKNLRALQRDVEELESLENQIASLRKQAIQLNDKAKETKHIEKLPTDTYEQLHKQMKEKLEKINERRKFMVIAGLIGGILAIAAVLSWVYYCSNTKGPMGMEAAHMAVLACFTGIFFVAVSFIDFDGCWGPSIAIFFGIYIFIINVVFAYETNLLLVVPLVGMVALMFVARRIRSVGLESRELSQEDIRELEEAKKQDEANARANEKAIKKEMIRQLNAVQSEVDDISKKVAALEKEAAPYRDKINSNSYLSVKDIKDIDAIIEKIVTHRADSIKEALHLLDDEYERRSRAALEDIQRRNRELAEQMRHDELMRQAELERIKADNHRKEMERKAKELRDDIEYHGRHGW